MKKGKKMSAEGRKRISDAQKVRWAKARKRKKIDAGFEPVKFETASIKIAKETPSQAEQAKAVQTALNSYYTSSQAQKKLDLIQQILNL